VSPSLARRKTPSSPELRHERLWSLQEMEYSDTLSRLVNTCRYRSFFTISWTPERSLYEVLRLVQGPEAWYHSMYVIRIPLVTERSIADLLPAPHLAPRKPHLDELFPSLLLLPMSSSNDPLLQVSDDASNRYPVADPALRKSCDRCYSQKLKCSKTDISPDCCVRCARAGVACFYSTRLARQSQKRLSSADSRGAQRLPKRSRHEPLTSPGFVDDALFDPMQRVHFDLDTTEITDASLLSTNHAEYAWPPEDWINTESVMTIPVLPEAPLSFIPQPEALSSDTSSAESHADKLPELSASILPDDHNEHSLNHSLTKVIRPTSHRSSSSSEVKLVRFGAYDKQVSLFHNRPLSAHEPYTGRATANTRAHASSYSEDLQALSHRLEEYHQRLSVADVRVDLYTCE
jgi:hypothetical protein